MSEEQHHNVPDWFIPDDEVVLANEHEKEEIDEEGDLDEPLCPHCGCTYENEEDGWYIHAHRIIEESDWEAYTDALGRVQGWSKSSTRTPSVWCTPAGEKKHEKMQPWDFQDF